MFINLLKADLKLITSKPILLSLTLIPFILVLIVKLCYSLIPDLIASGHRMQSDNYLTLILITVISSVPIVVGIILSAGFNDRENTAEPADIQKKIFLKTLLVRLTETVLLSFILVLLSIVVTDPVPSEGWLRTLYITVLLGLHSPLIYFPIANHRYNNTKPTVIYLLSGFFLFAIPSGLLLSSPWNIPAFLSPLYWISWAWVTSTLIESIFCGALSIIMMAGTILPILRILIKNKSE